MANDQPPSYSTIEQSSNPPSYSSLQTFQPNRQSKSNIPSVETRITPSYVEGLDQLLCPCQPTAREAQIVRGRRERQIQNRYSYVISCLLILSVFIGLIVFFCLAMSECTQNHNLCFKNNTKCASYRNNFRC
jgi:hypothetical protein